MLYHLSPTGVMATVLSNGSLSSNTSGEGDIRKNLVDNDLVECIVALPKQLFYNTGIPACIWFLRRNKTSSPSGDKGATEVLFIDASEMGYMKSRVHRDFTEEDIAKIRNTYHNWRKPLPPKGDNTSTPKGDNTSTPSGDRGYQDIKGFCKSAKLEAIQKHSYVLTPGRYVGIPDEEDDGIPFEDKMQTLTATLKEQMDKEQQLNEEIATQLAKIGMSL